MTRFCFPRRAALAASLLAALASMTGCGSDKYSIGRGVINDPGTIPPNPYLKKPSNLPPGTLMKADSTGYSTYYMDPASWPPTRYGR
jgi:hypothetical protein